MTPGYGAPLMGGTVAGNLANPGLRIVGGLIDAVIIFVVWVVVGLLFNSIHLAVVGLILQIAVAIGYLGYMWSTQGASIGMMPFGFKVRDVTTGEYPTLGKAMLRSFVWNIEFLLSFCAIGAVGWLWQLWDPRRQAIHDKAVGTIVTSA